MLISVTPPPQMPATLEQGTIQGYCVGEPWNQQAVAQGDRRSRRHRPRDLARQPREGVRRHGAPGPRSIPRRTLRLVKALIRAGKWLDESPENRQRAVEILARPEYVGADAAVIAASMTGSFEYAKGDRREMPDFNVFFRRHATYPYYGDGVWFLTQMRRWGQIGEAKPDAWYDETIRRVYRPDVWRAAAAAARRRGSPRGGRRARHGRLRAARRGLHRRRRLRRPPARTTTCAPSRSARRTEGGPDERPSPAAAFASARRSSPSRSSSGSGRAAAARIETSIGALPGPAAVLGARALAASPSTAPSAPRPPSSPRAWTEKRARRAGGRRAVDASAATPAGRPSSTRSRPA